MYGESFFFYAISHTIYKYIFIYFSCEHIYPSHYRKCYVVQSILIYYFVSIHLFFSSHLLLHHRSSWSPPTAYRCDLDVIHSSLFAFFFSIVFLTLIYISLRLFFFLHFLLMCFSHMFQVHRIEVTNLDHRGLKIEPKNKALATLQELSLYKFISRLDS